MGCVLNTNTVRIGHKDKYSQQDKVLFNFIHKNDFYTYEFDKMIFANPLLKNNLRIF